jgi:hypothetical protein
VQGMELNNLTDEGSQDGQKLPLSEDSLQVIAKTRTSVSVIDFINSLELHRETCDGKVVFQEEKKES